MNKLILIGLMTCSSLAVAQECGLTEVIKSANQRYIEVFDEQDNKMLLKVIVADDPEEQQAGFQYACPDEVDSNAILFKFKQEFTPSFHMNNVNAPIEIFFVNAKGDVVTRHTMETYQNNKKPLYKASEPILYALEVSPNFAKNNEVLDNAVKMSIE